MSFQRFQQLHRELCGMLDQPFEEVKSEGETLAVVALDCGGVPGSLTYAPLVSDRSAFLALELGPAPDPADVQSYRELLVMNFELLGTIPNFSISCHSECGVLVMQMVIPLEAGAITLAGQIHALAGPAMRLRRGEFVVRAPMDGRNAPTRASA